MNTARRFNDGKDGGTQRVAVATIEVIGDVGIAANSTVATATGNPLHTVPGVKTPVYVQASLPRLGRKSQFVTVRGIDNRIG